MIKFILLALICYEARTMSSGVESYVDSSNSAEEQVSSNTNSIDSENTEGQVSSNVQGAVGRRLLLNEKELVSDVDSVISGKRRNLSRCQDTSNGHCDSYGDCCDEYHQHVYWCGGYDTANFKSNKMCCACGGGSGKKKPQINLMTTTNLKKVFDDEGTGARHDGALWKPNNSSPWFSTVASNTYGGAQSRKGVYAQSNSVGMLKEPAYWEQIWNDRGSGACNDRSLWKAIPKSGYTCLGHVGIGWGGCRRGQNFPNNDIVRNRHFPNYKCVQSQHVVQISQSDLHRVWYDRGSGANDDASIWRYSSPNGYELAFANGSHHKPSGPFYDFKPSLF